MATPEKRLMQEIELWCGGKDYLCFHCNVGTFYTKEGIPIRTGLPNGFPDLLVFRNDGIACLVETKVHPRKPTADQLRFIEVIRRHGFRAGVAYSLDEAISIIEGENQK